MPKLDSNYENAQESKAGNAFKNMEPGAYMCTVQAVRTEWVDGRGKRWTSDQKQYVKLILDISDGEHAGRFSDDYWTGQEKDWGHTLYMSWTERALGMLKHTFAAFEDTNPGFDARAAFEADNWALFIGKRLRVMWSGQEYEGNDGLVKVRVRPDRAITSDENPAPRVEQLNGERIDWADWQAQNAAASTQVATKVDDYSDVPF